MQLKSIIKIFVIFVISIICILLYKLVIQNKITKNPHIFILNENINHRTIIRTITDSLQFKSSFNDKCKKEPIKLLNYTQFANTLKCNVEYKKENYILEITPSSLNRNNSKILTTISKYSNQAIVEPHYKELEVIFTSIIKDILIKSKDVYKFNIAETKLLDSTLISIKMDLKTYPTTFDIYNLVSELSDYAYKNNAKIINFPLVNVSKKEQTYLLMVALSLNKELPNQGRIIAKRLFPKGKYLKIESIIGGFASSEFALNKIIAYMDDYGYSSPAIPFIIFRTDRMQNKDTINWLSDIYYPVY